MTRTNTTTKKINYHSFYLRMMVVVVVQVLAALVVLAMVGLDPAHAAFPGANGKIVFQSERTTGTGVDNPEGDFEIFTMNPDGTGVTQLTNNTTFDGLPSFSADGRYVVFTSERDGNKEIYVMDTDYNTNDAKNLSNNPAYDDDSAWSPNGQRIAFTSIRSGNLEIHVMNADGSSQKRITRKATFDTSPAWSPGGTRIAFTRANVGVDAETYTMKARPEGRRNRPMNLTKNDIDDYAPDWQPLVP